MYQQMKCKLLAANEMHKLATKNGYNMQWRTREIKRCKLINQLNLNYNFWTWPISFYYDIYITQQILIPYILLYSSIHDRYK
jgi:hypothetical protein